MKIPTTFVICIFIVIIIGLVFLIMQTNNQLIIDDYCEICGYDYGVGFENLDNGVIIYCDGGNMLVEEEYKIRDCDME